MATITPHNLLHLSQNPLHGRSLSLPDQLPLRKSHFTSSKPIRSASSRSLSTVAGVMSRTNDSLSAIISEIQRERSEGQVEGEEREIEDESVSRDESRRRKRKAEEHTKLRDTWRQIQGEDDWAGLLDPMDPILRAELIRYGEIAQSCYDAFDFDPFSKYCGSCRFPRRRFFDSLGMADSGYEMTRYLYATSNINLPNFFKKSRWPKVWSKNANWIGYVAVSNDEATRRRLGRRDIAVSWRGTVTRLEWIADLMDFLKPVSGNKIPCPDASVKAESGFLDLYTDKDETCQYSKFSAREQILTEIKRLVDLYGDDDEEELSITITGHSLGGALATLSAYDIAETGVNVTRSGRVVPVTAFTYSGPRVGNVRFKERIEELGVKVLRVVNEHDIVPKSPGLFFNERVPQALMKIAEGLPWSYSHVGVELPLDHLNSPFLKPTADPACTHNLEALLHLLDGYHGKGRRFYLASGRDPALVNKASDFLKDHYMVPPFWRQDANKGMVRNHDGRWIQPERSRIEDHHHPDIHHYLDKIRPQES